MGFLAHRRGVGKGLVGVLSEVGFAGKRLSGMGSSLPSRGASPDPQRSPPVPADDRTSPSSRHAGGGASRRQTSCPDSGRPGSTSRRVLLATRCNRSTCCGAFQPMNRSRGRHFSAPACQPARPIQSVPRTATYRSPRPTKRRKPSSWRSAIRPSQRRRSSGRASRITTSATEGFWGKPSMPSNYQTEYEKFRPHESESTSKKNEIALEGRWTRLDRCQ